MHPKNHMWLPQAPVYSAAVSKIGRVKTPCDPDLCSHHDKGGDSSGIKSHSTVRKAPVARQGGPDRQPHCQTACQGQVRLSGKA
jgi:hypothetical protein